ncbi:MAG: nucleotidyl transferase AbiEii/AbiGii toxin family protein [Candidatus Sulfotelmatobacter sp.]
MITDQEIQEKAREFGINPVDVEKDYVHGWVLNGLFTQSALSNHLVLKGGNGLRKAYLTNTRFSKDLDFSCEHSVDPAILVDELKRVCAFVEHHAEVRFSPERTVVKKKDLAIGIDAVEARLYFKGFYGEENLTLKAQLDITQFDKIDLPIQARPLLHPYSDNDHVRPLCGVRR